MLRGCAWRVTVINIFFRDYSQSRNFLGSFLFPFSPTEFSWNRGMATQWNGQPFQSPNFRYFTANKQQQGPSTSTNSAQNAEALRYRPLKSSNNTGRPRRDASWQKGGKTYDPIGTNQGLYISMDEVIGQGQMAYRGRKNRRVGNDEYSDKACTKQEKVNIKQRRRSQKCVFSNGDVCVQPIEHVIKQECKQSLRRAERLLGLFIVREATLRENPWKNNSPENQRQMHCCVQDFVPRQRRPSQRRTLLPQIVCPCSSE